MKAMILAAGKGQRMLPLTQKEPKPLLMVQGHTLIGHMLFKLQRAGIREVIINVHYFAEKMMAVLGDGSQYGVKIFYSHEKENILGTGGGVYNALALLGNAPFLLLSADIFTDYNLSNLTSLPEGVLAHLVFVNNPEYNSDGDYALDKGAVVMQGDRFTYANIALLSPEVFAQERQGEFCLSAVFNKVIANKQVTGEFYNGHWFNVGTPDILESLNRRAGKPIFSGCKKKRA